jgi:hypothetical protein
VGASGRSRQRAKTDGPTLTEAGIVGRAAVGLLEARVLDESLGEKADRRAAAV